MFRLVLTDSSPNPLISLGRRFNCALITNDAGRASAIFGLIPYKCCYNLF